MRGAKFLLFLLSCVMLLFIFSGCGKGLKYQDFSVNEPGLIFSFAYPEGWVAARQAGSSYLQYLFLEPQNKDEVFRAMIALSGRDSTLTLEQAVNDLAGRRMGFRRARLLHKSKIKAAGLNGAELEFSYEAPVDFSKKTGSPQVAVKERVVILKQGARLYIIRYQNTAQEFAGFKPAFQHALKTLKIGR